MAISEYITQHGQNVNRHYSSGNRGAQSVVNHDTFGSNYLVLDDLGCLLQLAAADNSC